MHTRGWSAGGLRSFLLVAMLVTLSGQVNATDVRLQFNNVSPSQTVSNPVLGGSTNAGLYNWTQLAVSPGPAGILTGSGGLSTYCINLGQTLQSPDWYRVVTGIAGIATLPNPNPSPAMGIAASQRLAILANELGGGVLSTYAGNHVAVQVAIWNVTRGNSLNDITGMTAAQSNAVTAILNFLFTANLATYDYTNANYFAVALDSLSGGAGSEPGNGQDQIFFVSREQYQQIVPVPAGVVMAGMGVICLGGFNLYRRRKMVVAA